MKNLPDSSMPEKVEWQLLMEEWHRKKLAMIEAENELDAQVLSYLDNNGARPSQTLVDQVEDCRHQEYEARGLMNNFIFELP